VQGVGFRPFIYRLAQEFHLAGYVRNLRGDVEIVIEGQVAAAKLFQRAIVERAPPLAQPRIHSSVAVRPRKLRGFEIAASNADDAPQVSVPPDFFACADCLREMRDPQDRRYRYAFINCTQCGPRYTLIESLPYDRPNTSMASFPLCPECRREYEDPLNRRFHAEPVACPKCGPHLTFRRGEATIVGDDAQALAAALEALRAGEVVAVRGIGGYHLLCDARSEPAVARLRERKPRPHKPLAVMYPISGDDGLGAVRHDLAVGPLHQQMLVDPARPIVLIPKRAECSLAPSIAPGLLEVGAFLPYSPLHALLLGEFDGPLVATSGNVSGEPVLTDREEAEQRIAQVADAFLHHDRRIVRPADDSVVSVIAGAARPLRLGRGRAPLELELPFALPEPVLAVGGHLKLTVALAWDRRIVVSPHIGDMGTLRSERVFAQVVEDLQRLYDVRAQRWICDAHPNYVTTRWARSRPQPCTEVFHHHAHASGLVLEHRCEEPALVFAWDGVGYGADGTLWGGEAFLGRMGQWERVGSLRPFHLPGGDKAGRAPWRSAAALCWEMGRDCPVPIPDPIVQSAWERKLNCPQSSAAGRVFDAASALVLGVTETSFEGQGPMLLEASAGEEGWFPTLDFLQGPDGLTLIDWEPLVNCAVETRMSVRDRATAVHLALADAIVRFAALHVARSGVTVVGLTGGVFQNRRLTEMAASRLADLGVRVLLPRELPCNDGGISHGQVADFLGRTV
jgi:hydrogenase maturation protein HypF